VAAGAGIERHPKAQRTSLDGRNVTRRHRILDQEKPPPPNAKAPRPEGRGAA
jgi:hypothetical protein